MAPSPTGPRPESGSARRAWIVSALIHAIVIAGLAAIALLAPPPPPVVAVFELVSVEKPKLRPLAPKTPEPPPEKPPESRPPEAPKPVAKPKRPAAPKPEPKVVRPAAPDTSLPVRETPRENAVLSTTLVANMPSDPRLAFWAGRVKRRVESLWNPPSGIDVRNGAKTVVSFEVARDGRVGAVTVATSSGNNLLDDLAKRTILRLESVVPIPENFPGDILKVSYEFIYNAP
jgi:protein TonB